MRQITHVAIWDADDETMYSLPAPNHHRDILNAYPKLRDRTIRKGFLDDQGKWLNRRNAFILAVANGQLKLVEPLGHYQNAELHSGEIW